ncbi:MAG: 16S rRNA (guanine(966)-N(2))-methyltransferase RsmD [Candidatus Omnitrophica bacterium]|nr:16S rRNA (guanine(966)-N(2))-methyltransferase RsmD [Candidatus Omnitrophota bacterium]
MRIFGGKFKGKSITVPLDIRPVSLKIKKSCFDILRGEIEGKRVLDLFGGSGSLGIEALSQGAKEAIFVDSSRRSVAAIRKNLAFLGLDPKQKVLLKDSVSGIKDFFTYKESFDIIFLDPPYHSGLATKSLQLLEEYDIVCPSGYVVTFCSTKDDFVQASKGFSLIVEKKYGQTLFLIYRRYE